MRVLDGRLVPGANARACWLMVSWGRPSDGRISYLVAHKASGLRATYHCHPHHRPKHGTEQLALGAVEDHDTKVAAAEVIEPAGGWSPAQKVREERVSSCYP